MKISKKIVNSENNDFYDDIVIPAIVYSITDNKGIVIEKIIDSNKNFCWRSLLKKDEYINIVDEKIYGGLLNNKRKQDFIYFDKHVTDFFDNEYDILIKEYDRKEKLNSL